MTAIRQDCYEVHLTKGYVALVDWEDADLCGELWYAQVIARKRKTYVYAAQRKHALRYLHIEVARRKDPEGVGLVDHANGDTLDCRRRNIRWLTRSLNNANQQGNPTRGVSFQKATQKWKSVLGRKFLGYFATQEEAVRARAAAEKEAGL